MVLDLLKDRLKNRQLSDPDYIVALDIGTEFVKALIGEVQPDRLEVIGIGRTRQRLSDMHSGAISDIAGVVENCEAALTAAEEMANVSIRSAVVGLAGELVKGTTSTISYRRDNPNESLEMAELEDIMQKVRDRAEARARAELAWESGNENLEIRMVNSALTSVTIDGYRVTNPIGFQGSDVSIQLFTAFAPMVHIGAIERVATELDLNLVSVSAEPYAVARSVTNSNADSTFSAILIDVGGGTTDIAVVNDGGVEGTKMFGIGGRSFTHSVAQRLDVDFDRAEAMKLRSNNTTDDTKAEREVTKALQDTLDVWLDGVTLALQEFDEIDHLPPRILLCGGGASLNMLVDKLKQPDWHSDLPFTKQPEVKHIHPNEVIDVVDGTGEIDDHSLITAMGLLKIGYDTLQLTEPDSSWSGRLNRILRI